MTQEHPITPPPELVREWYHEANLSGAPYEDSFPNIAYEQHIATRAAQWGADQELEACCEWLEQQTLCGHQDLLPSFCAARRPKPPSLKEQALEALDEEQAELSIQNYKLIRAVLEALPE